MPVASFVLVLGGAMKGKTIRLNGYRFVDGECALRGSEDDKAAVCRYFGKSYMCTLKGDKPAPKGEETPTADKTTKRERPVTSNAPAANPQTGGGGK